MMRKVDYEKILDDLKLIAKCAKVVSDENDQPKRQYAFGLLSDLVDRLYSDIVSAKNSKAEQSKLADIVKEKK